MSNLNPPKKSIFTVTLCPLVAFYTPSTHVGTKFLNYQELELKYLLFGIFVIVPIAEIATFIQVGDIIGLWPTLGIILLTAFLGTGLLRYQGIATLNQAQTSLNDGELPLAPVVHGVFLLAAGLLLLTPGFITDAIGFLLFFPPLRLLIGKWVIEKIKTSKNTRVQTGSPAGSRSAPPVIEGEFTVADEDSGDADEASDPQKPPDNAPSSDSPWRQ